MLRSYYSFVMTAQPTEVAFYGRPM